MTFTNMKYLSCFIMVALVTVQSYTLEDTTRLKNMLFLNYDKGLRPIHNQSNAIEVNIRMYIQNIIQFDMSNGQLDIMGYMIVSWRDETMAWYGSKFDGIDSIGLDGNELWHPAVSQLNAMTDEVQLDSITLIKDGTVVRVVIRKFYTFCDLNMRFYPNDKHDCKFEFLSLKYPIGQVILIPEFDRIGQNFLTKHGEWEITDSSVTSRKEHAIANTAVRTIAFKFDLQRQPAFNVIHRSVPLIIVAISVLFIHVVPLNSGERISYAVTLQLSLIFWQALIAEELPKNSSQISIFSMIVTAILFSTGIVTILSVILCRVASLDSDREIPVWIQRLARKVRPKRKQNRTFQRRKSNASFDYGFDVSNVHVKSHDRQNIHGHSDALRNVHGYTDDRSNYHRKTDSMKVNISTSRNGKLVEDHRSITWIEGANAIDLVLFYISLAVIILSSVAYVLIFAMI